MSFLEILVGYYDICWQIGESILMNKKTLVSFTLVILLIICLMVFFYSTAIDLSFIGYNH